MIVNDLENKELSLKIIDFGLSLNTQTALRGVESTFGGTPGYISPEQFRTNYLSEAADSFSIGGIIYFMYFFNYIIGLLEQLHSLILKVIPVRSSLTEIRIWI